MKKGYTLVELMVVIAIFGILAGILIPAITGASGKNKTYNKPSQDKVWNGSTNGW